MRPRSEQLVRWGLASSMALVLGACKADDSVLYSKVWPCDADSPMNQCGTARNGQPMACVSAKHLGGTDFCTESCDVVAGSPDPDHYACLSSGALLKKCDPNNINADCPAGFSCYRTSIESFAQEGSGLCIVMPVCNDDSACADQAPRVTCGSTLLGAGYRSPHLSLDQLNCVQLCSIGDASTDNCPPGELCLEQVYSTSTNIPFFCVPACAASDPPCPPNYFCLHDAGPAYPTVCVPGIPGRRCSHEEDCIAGDCVNLGDNYKICALSCAYDDFCRLLSGTWGQFFCDKVLGDRGYCVARGPFAGEYCADSSNCAPDQICSNFDPFNPAVHRGTEDRECHTTCDGPGTCPTKAGIVFACQPVDGSYAKGECYPADFGIRCDPATEQCMGGSETCAMQCLGVNVNIDANASDPSDLVAMCTRQCSDNSQCGDCGLTMDGFCANGVCQRRRRTGEVCNDPQQCASGVCGAQGTCQ